MARAPFWLLLVGTHPSPGHFTSQWLFPESWQPLGIALFTAPPWLRISIESPVEKPVNRLKLEQFHAVALQCNLSSWFWPNWWNFELSQKRHQVHGSLEACSIGTKARLVVMTHQLAQLNTHLLSNNFIVKQQHGILISPSELLKFFLELYFERF